MATLPYKFSETVGETPKGEHEKAKTFHCLVVSPDGKIFEDNLDYVQAPGLEGSFGVLAMHTPFISILKAGVIFLKRGVHQLSLQIPAGTLEVNGSHDVLILCDSAQAIEMPAQTTSAHN